MCNSLVCNSINRCNSNLRSSEVTEVTLFDVEFLLNRLFGLHTIYLNSRSIVANTSDDDWNMLAFYVDECTIRVNVSIYIVDSICIFFNWCKRYFIVCTFNKSLFTSLNSDCRHLSSTIINVVVIVDSYSELRLAEELTSNDDITVSWSNLQRVVRITRSWVVLNDSVRNNGINRFRIRTSLRSLSYN